MEQSIQTSAVLKDVRYEIRGQLANHALELEKRGYEIISLNIGNPGLFGFRTPETMRLAMIENLGQAEPYCHQKGIFPAREAVVMQQQNRGVPGVSADEVFIGNGVSELIDLSLRALLTRVTKYCTESRLPAMERCSRAKWRCTETLCVSAGRRIFARPCRHGKAHQ